MSTPLRSPPSPLIPGDRWWPQTAKQDGDRIDKQFLCNTLKKRNERPNVGGVSIRSGNGTPSRRDAWSMVKRLRQATNEYAPPLPPAPSLRHAFI